MAGSRNNSGWNMRPSLVLMLILSVYLMLFAALVPLVRQQTSNSMADVPVLRDGVARLGLTDLALSTEARYTRHPAVSDAVAQAMDHPGAIDHFPSTLFWAPPQ